MRVRGSGGEERRCRALIVERRATFLDHVVEKLLSIGESRRGVRVDENEQRADARLWGGYA